jgi:hemoglobin
MVPESLIRDVVETFYARALNHPRLGPIFRERVADWSLHLPRMVDFWHSVLNTSGRYKGRPVPAHQALPGLDEALFRDWLALWRETVREFADPVTAADMIEKAERIAESLAAACLDAGEGRPPVFARVA